MNIEWKIPNLNNEGDPATVSIVEGTVVFIVGANGSGKSALLTHLSKAAGTSDVVRIAAHRQTWLNSNSVDLTQKSRKDVERNIKARDRHDDSRFKDDYASPRAQAALFDLANAQNTMAREVLSLLSGDNEEEAKVRAKMPSPIESMNDILALSALTVRLSINDEGDILAQHNDNEPFSIIQLSDGERNAVMLAAQILTAKPETLFLVDEPERHLHRSITEPLLRALFEKRKDCCFVVATHEPELPRSHEAAQVLIARECGWQGAAANGWLLDIVPANLDVPDAVKQSIIGARRAILFTEGEPHSLDYPLLSAILPGLSISPQGGCREVQRSVAGLRATEELHWLTPLGLIDRDDRPDEEVAQLATEDVYSLDVSTIESIFYSIQSISAVAELQARIFDLEKDDLIENAINAALSAMNEDLKKNFAAMRAQKTARNRMMSELPDWKTIKENGGASIVINIDTTFADEMEKLNDAMLARDLTAITKRYSIKKSPLPSSIANALRFSDKRHYEEAVVTLAKKDMQFREKLKEFIQPIVDRLA